MASLKYILMYKPIARKITKLKSHDCHMLMQLLPISLQRSLLEKSMWTGVVWVDVSFLEVHIQFHIFMFPFLFSVCDMLRYFFCNVGLSSNINLNFINNSRLYGRIAAEHIVEECLTCMPVTLMSVKLRKVHEVQN